MRHGAVAGVVKHEGTGLNAGQLRVGVSNCTVCTACTARGGRPEAWCWRAPRGGRGCESPDGGALRRRSRGCNIDARRQGRLSHVSLLLRCRSTGRTVAVFSVFVILTLTAALCGQVCHCTDERDGGADDCSHGDGRNDAGGKTPSRSTAWGGGGGGYRRGEAAAGRDRDAQCRGGGQLQGRGSGGKARRVDPLIVCVVGGREARGYG